MSVTHNLNIYKKNELIRGDIDESEENCDEVKSKASNITKKKVNIPIGDVNIDSDYDKMVSNDYQLPSIFVRHTRKVGDEADLLVDYVMEDDDALWMKTNPKIVNDKELSKALTVEVFEYLINLYEKHTGFGVDCLPLHQIVKYLPQTKLPDLIPPSVINKLMNEVYLYWSHKRNHGNSAKINSSQGKALCRKYWIPTPASDTNPHHTFRPRDKERYRLRRQQKKNDLESFQKLQQVRREFAQARILSQLIVEREKLTESSLEIQHRIFEQTLIDNKLGYLLEEPGSDGVSKKKSTGAFKHTLTYEHLLRPLTTTATQEQLQQLVGSFTDKNRNANRNANTLRKMGIMSKKSSGSSASAASKDDNVEEADSETGPSDKMKTLKKLGLVSGLKRKRGSTDASGASSGAANRNSEKINQIELIQNNQQIMSHYEALLGSLLQASNNPSAANPAALLSSAQGSSSASVFNTLLEQIYVSNPEHFNKLSPLYQTVLYRTFYPDFMEESSVRPNSIEEAVPMMNSTNNSEYLSRYMDDLLLKHTYDCDSIDVEDSIGEDAYIPMEKYRLSIHYPDTFRCRGRIGRNGRLVTDRIPVYKSDRDHNGMPTGVKTNTDHSINVVYGAVLKNKQSVPGDAGNQLQVPTLPLANFGINYNYMDADNDEYQCHGHNYMNHVHGNVNNQSLHSHDGYDLYRLNMQDLMNYPHTGENIHMKLKLSENGSGNSNTNSIYNISL